MTANPRDVLVYRDAPDPATPVLLTGLAAAALARADGEARCEVETRGGIIDWGGAYAQGVRLTGPWALSVLIDGTEYPLGAGLVQLQAERGVLTSQHQLGPLHLTQELYPHPDTTAVIRRLVVQSDADAPLPVRIGSAFAPLLAPVLVEGIQPYRFRARSRGPTVEVTSFGHVLWIDSLPVASSWLLNGLPWEGGRVEEEVHSFESIFDRSIAPGETWTLDLVLSGGAESQNPGGPGTGRALLASAAAGAAEVRERWERWTAGTPTLRFPDDPALEAAYERARTAVRALYCHPTSEITGLVAGYPWYAALWCRDLAWMLPAVLWLGDFDWVERSLTTVFRYQSDAVVPLLGATVGELPMQISPGPVFLYGTSDTSLHYPPLARRFLGHTGRTSSVDRWWPNLRAIEGWARAKITPGTGLFRNGGEALAAQDAASTLGEVHFGIDAFDTTIWDSTDRRDHAIDLQVLYHQTMESLPEIARGLARLSEVAGMEVERDRIGVAVRTQYGWEAEGYLYDSLRMDGSPVARLRPNALRTVSAGMLETDQARSIVERAFRPDLATAWGLRTLSDMDPKYDPRAYHDGQVWPIATAWAADAALAIGDVDRGLSALHILAERIFRENGLANECYRGDRDAPFDSCFLLGFSVAPFLSVLFERLWGIELTAIGGTVRIAPRFPAEWTSASLHGLRFGDGRMDIDWTPGKLTVFWSGPGTLIVDTLGGSTPVEPDATTAIAVR